MDESSSKRTVFVSTETEKGKLALRTANVACWITGFGFVAAAVFIGFAPDRFFSPPGDFCTRILLVLSYGGLFLQIMYLYQFEAWRQWAIMWLWVPLFMLLVLATIAIRREHHKMWKLRKSST